MKILVTGANGFIGRSVIHRLKKTSHEVFVHQHSEGDIATTPLKFEKIDHVIHLAARTFVPDSWNEPYDFYHTNVMGTENILEYCRKNGCRLTYLSTYLYGQPQYLPIDEKHPIQTNTPYHHSKLLAEEICNFYAREYELKTRIFRCFNTYGPGQKKTFLIPLILSQILDPRIESVQVASLKPKRDHLYIEDLVSALTENLDKNQHSVLYNLGSGYSVSILEVIETAYSVLGYRKPIVDLAQERKNEIMETVADISKTKKELGWKPLYSLKDGITKMIEEMKNEKN